MGTPPQKTELIIIMNTIRYLAPVVLILAACGDESTTYNLPPPAEPVPVVQKPTPTKPNHDRGSQDEPDDDSRR